MQAFLFTEQLQDELISALQNNTILDFWKTHRDLIKKLATQLKLVKIPVRKEKNQLPYDQVCIFICYNLLELLMEIVTPNKIEVKEGSIEQAFVQKLLYEGVERQEWHYFYERHEQIFDTIILWARRQHVLNVYIERNSGKKYLFLEDARLSRNRVMEDRELERYCCCNCFHKIKKHLYGQDRKPTVNAITPPQIFDSPGDSLSSQASSGYHTLTNAPIPAPSLAVQRSDNLAISDKKQEKRELADYETELKVIREVPVQSVVFESYSTRAPSSRNNNRNSNPVQVHRTPSSSSQASIDWAERNRQMDESFQRKLNAQNAKHQEQLRELREKRERMNREAEEHIRKLREESATRIRFFLQCVVMKIRWEGQQNEWEKWLKAARDPILKVKNRIGEFSSKPFIMIKRQYDNEDLKSAMLELQGDVQLAYDKLVDDFGDLAALIQTYEEKLFLKVLQKIIGGMADKLCELLEGLERFQPTEPSFNLIKSLESTIHAWDIPTATGLRRICETAREQDYTFVTPPRQPKRSNYNFTEI